MSRQTLAEMLRRVTGTSFRVWTDDNVFRPLGRIWLTAWAPDTLLHTARPRFPPEQLCASRYLRGGLVELRLHNLRAALFGESLHFQPFMLEAVRVGYSLPRYDVDARSHHANNPSDIPQMPRTGTTLAKAKLLKDHLFWRCDRNAEPDELNNATSGESLYCKRVVACNVHICARA